MRNNTVWENFIGTVLDWIVKHWKPIVIIGLVFNFVSCFCTRN